MNRNDGMSLDKIGLAWLIIYLYEAAFVGHELGLLPCATRSDKHGNNGFYRHLYPQYRDCVAFMCFYSPIEIPPHF